MSSPLYSQRKPEWYAPYLDRYKPLIPPFIELGAGHGLLLELVRSRGIDGYGVEFDPERVAICQEKGLNVIQHDLGNPLPYEDESFGAIYCGQVIEHMPTESQKVMLSEAFRILKKGGTFQVCSPCRHDEFSRNQDSHDFLLTPTELKQMLQAAGFENIRPINYCQKVPEIPPDVLKDIWAKYQPDLLSETANAICIK